MGRVVELINYTRDGGRIGLYKLGAAVDSVVAGSNYGGTVRYSMVRYKCTVQRSASIQQQSSAGLQCCAAQ